MARHGTIDGVTEEQGIWQSDLDAALLVVVRTEKGIDFKIMDGVGPEALREIARQLNRLSHLGLRPGQREH